MAVMAVISKGTSISAGNLRSILVQSSTRGLAAIGELFVLLTAGIDLSVGSTDRSGSVSFVKIWKGGINKGEYKKLE